MQLTAFALSSILTSLATTVSAHTRFTTLFVDGVSQGDGTCVRMDQDPGHTTFPIDGITSSDMACGKDGEIVVPQTCQVKVGGTLSFLHRMYIDGSQPGVIDESHKGPCSVYMKQVSSSPSTSSFPSTSAAGDGWFKVYEESYDETSQLWCTEKLIANGGLLSTTIPSDLGPGQYLARVELLALQNAQNGDPQFYAGCAQVAIEGATGNTGMTTRAIPETISIPDGYVSLDMDAMKFNIYDQPMKLPYPMYGPKVYGSGSAGSAGNIILANTSSSSAASSVSSSENVASTGSSTPVSGGIGSSTSSSTGNTSSSSSSSSITTTDPSESGHTESDNSVNDSGESTSVKDDCEDEKEKSKKGNRKNWKNNKTSWGRTNRTFGGH